MAIYILKCPAEAGNLLKYAATIRELHSNHGDLTWRQYDEGFRRLRQSHHPPIDELYTKAANRRNNVQSAVTSQAGGRRYGDNNSHNRPFRNRVCFAYNRGGPVQTPVDSDIIARSAGQPPIQIQNALNCYARGQLRMQRNQTLPTPVQPDALKQQLHGYREDLYIWFSIGL